MMGILPIGPVWAMEIFPVRSIWKIAPNFRMISTHGRVIIGDINGDGLDDLVYVDHCRVLLWINQSGKRWSDPIEIDGTPELTDPDAVRTVDLLGYGVSGLLWTGDSRGKQQIPYVFPGYHQRNQASIA